MSELRTTHMPPHMADTQVWKVAAFAGNNFRRNSDCSRAKFGGDCGTSYL